MIRVILSLVLLWYLDKHVPAPKSKASPKKAKPQVPPSEAPGAEAASPEVAETTSPEVAEATSPEVAEATSPEEDALSDLTHAITTHLNEHGGLHTAEQIASALGKPQDQVQQALNQLVDQEQVAVDKARYGTSAEVEALQGLKREIAAHLQSSDELMTASELATALNRPEDEVQQILDQLQADGEVGAWDGRYGTPEEVQALRQVADVIRGQLAQTATLDTASELAGALGQPEAEVQQVLDELSAQGEITDWNGHYGTLAEVEAMRDLGREIVAHLQSSGELLTASELASALNRPEDQVQQVLDQLQADGEVGAWDGRYGIAAQVEALEELGRAILTQLEEGGMQTASELATALGRPEAEVQQALDQLQAQGAVKDLDGRYGTPDQIDQQMALEASEREAPPAEAEPSRYALGLNGSNSSVSVPDDEALQIAAYTVEVWIKPDGVPNETWKGIVGKPGRNHHIWLHRNGHIHHAFHNANTTNFHFDTPASTIAWDQWSHVAITNDGSTAVTYINGAKQAENTSGGMPIVDHTTLYMGQDLDGNARRYFNGQMAEVRIWDHARSEADIQANMNHRLHGTEAGLVGYWPLDETEGEVAHDRSANGNHGTIHNAARQPDAITLAPAAEPPAAGCVLALDGNDYIELPHVEILNPAQFTISCWVKVAGGQGAFRSPITSRSDPPSRGYMIYASNRNTWAVWTGEGVQAGNWVGVSGATVTLNQWTHVAVTYNGTHLRLYVNGSMEADQPRQYTPNPDRPLRIGAGSTEGNPRYFFNGQMAEVCIWNRARSVAQIQADMNRRLYGTEAGLVGYWPLDECDGQVAHDRSANGNDGTIHGGTWQPEAIVLQPAIEPEPAPAEDNGALAFGGSAYVDCGRGIDLVNKSFTVEFWAQRGDTGRAQTFFRQSESRRPTRNHALHIGFRRGNQYYVAFWGNNIDTQGAYTDRGWHHWAMTYDHNTNTQNLYYDGEPVVEPNVTDSDCLATGNFLIGEGYGDQSRFRGAMSEMRIWDHVRSEAQLKASMNQRLTGNESGLTAYWPMNEGSGSTISDKSGNGHNGTRHGGAWRDDPDLGLTAS